MDKQDLDAPIVYKPKPKKVPVNAKGGKGGKGKPPARGGMKGGKKGGTVIGLPNFSRNAEIKAM